MDRKMYLEMKKREFERVNNKDMTLSQAYTEYLKDNQKEMEYFRLRDEIEKAQAAEAEKEIEKQIEERLPQFLDDVLKDLLKDFK